MRDLMELGEGALARGINTLLPLYSKAASAVSGIGRTPAGRVVTGATATTISTGLRLAGSVVEQVHRIVSPEEPTLVVAERATPPKARTAKRPPRPSRPSSTRPKKVTAKRAPRKEAEAPSADWADIPSVKGHAPMAETPSGAPAMGADPSAPPAIAGYDSLDPAAIGERLDGLTQTELAHTAAYEREHAARSEVLAIIGSRLVDLPLPTYDSLSAAAIMDAAATLAPGDLQTLRDYEAATRNRLPILERIDDLLAPADPES